MSEKIVEAVAKAIYEEMDLSDSLALPEATRYARAAIQAYEAAKREDRYVTRIENGVVYFSDGTEENPAEEIKAAQAFGGGLVDRAVRETSEAIPYLMKGLNPFDEEGMRPREDKLNWERPE